MMRGAIREDDGMRVITDNPHDVDYINRFCNHFYDPKLNVRFESILCVGDDLSASPAWAAGVYGVTTGAIPRPLPLAPPNPFRANHYSLQDGREAMWRALTLKQFRAVPDGPLLADPSPDGVGVVLRDLPSPTAQLGLYDGSNERAKFSTDPVTARRQYRDAYWATTWFALGSLLHLNQDMAQPQHTRIEAHPIGPRADYERYSDMRAKSDELIFSYRSRADGIFVPLPAHPLEYSNTDASIPSFATLSDFWSTAATGDVANGKGLGDHSNSRFFSQGHNLGNGTYALPSNSPGDYVSVDRIGFGGETHRYLAAAVPDPWSGVTHPILMTRLTPLAEFRSRRSLAPSPRVGNRLDYMLDATVFDDYLSVLIPTAVRYSQGLINWYFRGRMAISAPDEGVYALVDHAVEYSNAQAHGFPKLKAKVANTSARDEIGTGYIVGIVKFHRYTCTPLIQITADEAFRCRSGDEDLVVSKPIAVTGIGRTPTQYTFEFPKKIPISATDVKLQVVFRGRLGAESDAVVVAGKDLFEPTIVTFHSNIDYITLGNDAYSRSALERLGLPNVLSIVPGNCVVYGPGQPPKLWPDCFKEDAGASMIVEVGTRPARIEMRNLPVRQYSRIAYLSESASNVLRTDKSPCRFRNDAIEVPNLKYQADFYDYVGGGVEFTYPTYTWARGQLGWYVTGCTWWGDGTGPATNAFWAQMDALPEGQPPVPVTKLDF